MLTVRRFGALVATVTLGCAGGGYFETDDWWTVRLGHQTTLTAHGPSPQPYEPLPSPPAGVQLVHYPSGERELPGWYVPPPPAGHCPGGLVVYFHGGFAFGPADLYDVGALYSAGFAVFAPVLRGENGSPGDHERFYGELDDAVAAVRWAAAQPGVDPTRVVTYGHSAGGVLSSLIALTPDVPVAWTASAGGLFDEAHFDTSLALPFDKSDRLERRLRVFPHWAKSSMKRRHLAYIGTEDAPVVATAERLGGLDAPLELRKVTGSHYDSLKPATEDLTQELVRWCKGL